MKSVIANIDVLGARVDQDVQAEQVIEAKRQEEIRKRIAERKKAEIEIERADTPENGNPPGKLLLV